MKKYFGLINLLLFILLFVMTGPATAGKNLFKLTEDIEIHGFSSTSYSYNFNRPASQTNCGAVGSGLTGCVRIFDLDDNSFKMDNTELVFLKNADDIGDIGFRVDLTFGFSLPEGAQRARSSAVGTTTRHPNEPGDDDFDLQQSYVTWKAPIGSGLTIDVGHFVTHVGAEVFSGYDGWNPTFSRTFAFGWGIPFNHTGIRASYTLNDQWSFMFMIANNWEEAGVTDNNSEKNLGGQIGYTPMENLSILFNWVGGNQGTLGGNGGNDDWRNIFDTVIDIGITKKLSLQVNADYGTEENAGPTNNMAVWWGVNSTARYDFNNWFSMNARVGWFRDEDGFRLGVTGGNLREITITPEFRILDNMIVRFEYRHDDSTQAVFEKKDGSGSTSQDTVAFNTLIHF